MASKVNRRQRGLFPPEPFKPNPPKICPVYGTAHNHVRIFKPDAAGRMIVVLSCECGDEQAVDLVARVD